MVSLTLRTCGGTRKASVPPELQPPFIRLGTRSQQVCLQLHWQGTVRREERTYILGTGTAEHPASLVETWVPPQARKKTGVGTGDVEAGRSELQGLPQPHDGLKVSLGCMRPCLKDRNFSVLSHVPNMPDSFPLELLCQPGQLAFGRSLVSQLWDKNSNLHLCPHLQFPLPG